MNLYHTNLQVIIVTWEKFDLSIVSQKRKRIIERIATTCKVE